MDEQSLSVGVGVAALRDDLYGRGRKKGGGDARDVGGDGEMGGCKEGTNN